MAGGKGKKKKWNKGKVREKLQNLVLFDEKTYERLKLEIPKMKLITVATTADRLKITGSLARAALKELEQAGSIRVVSYHSKSPVYSRATLASD
jgi:small subunit ribosomal protein S25e